MISTTVAIIGAGPAGLAAGFHLKKHGIAALIIERGEAGDSWLKMPDFFKLVTPNWTNKLPGRPYRVLLRAPRCNEYGQYLGEYARLHDLRILTRTNCSRVTSREPRGFRLECGDETVLCDEVILCCGYFSTPYVPAEFDLAKTSDIIHASSIRQLADVAHARKILIVGKRETAGQIAGKVLAGTDCEVTLSYSAPLVIRRNHTLPGKMREKLYFFYEPLKCAFAGARQEDSFPPMDSFHIHRYLDSERLRHKPRLTRWSDGMATFADHSIAAFDLVVLATGYRKSAERVQIEAAGRRIHTLGVDHQVDFRSRYLRGIRRDAAGVVKDVLKSLALHEGPYVD